MALLSYADVSPAAASLLLPESAFLDSGKVHFLRGLLERLPRKVPVTSSAGAGAGPSARGCGGSKKGAPSSSTSSTSADAPPPPRYESRVLVFSQFTQVLDILGVRGQ